MLAVRRKSCSLKLKVAGLLEPVNTLSWDIESSKQQEVHQDTTLPKLLTTQDPRTSMVQIEELDSDDDGEEETISVTLDSRGLLVKDTASKPPPTKPSSAPASFEAGAWVVVHTRLPGWW